MVFRVKGLECKVRGLGVDVGERGGVPDGLCDKCWDDDVERHAACIHRLVLRVQGLGFKVHGAGFRVQGLGVRVRVWLVEFEVLGVKFSGSGI